MLVRIDENLARSEPRIFRDFPFRESFHFERQYIWHGQGFA